MSDLAGRPTISPLGDIVSTTQIAEIVRLLDAVRQPSLRDLPGGEHGPAAQQLRRQSRSMPTSALHASVHQALQLLGTRPPVDPQAYGSSRRRLGTLMSQRAVEEDWIERLQARSTRSGRLGDTEGRKALDADIQLRKQRRRRLMSLERHAERIVEDHDRHHQALRDWQIDHLQQLLQARLHAQAVLDRQERALDEVAATPPPYLLAELGASPPSPEARQTWRQGALAILRFRKDYGIQDPDQALGHPSVDTPHRLHRSQVEVLIDQTRQLIHQPPQPFPLGEPFDAPDLGLP